MKPRDPLDLALRILHGTGCGEVDMQALQEPEIAALQKAGLTAEADLLQHETYGGECFRCHKPWKRIDVDTRDQGRGVAFHYFGPGCGCMPRCKVCGALLWVERIIGSKFCRNCGAGVLCRSSVVVYRGKDKFTQPCGKPMELSPKGWICSACGHQEDFGHSPWHYERKKDGTMRISERVFPNQ